MASEVAMRLAKAIVIAGGDKSRLSGYARALDSAGVRRFVEAAEVVVNYTWPPDEAACIELESALAALAGIGEVDDAK